MFLSSLPYNLTGKNVIIQLILFYFLIPPDVSLKTRTPVKSLLEDIRNISKEKLYGKRKASHKGCIIKLPVTD